MDRQFSTRPTMVDTVLAWSPNRRLSDGRHSWVAETMLASPVLGWFVVCQVRYWGLYHGSWLAGIGKK